ncbi:MAG: hypothetical protein CO030_01250 [Candidatus Magasanikbacteria bacterium CG_4_9_14_0_2_um_filter_42_11]|uniref:EamA domain-containing protein n=1 Tax=Candidatus Magasanikbacteria bacterium CG_4_9_14_0_2_um_filter_42_11 TaxID=1974643 RepID=A0A2M8FAH9_9BACT|nr:MAG: hypothetical protein COY70_02180 [Candidatus Magasanikbacteria bacterium CG_4_10_14_0_8_um_filter_42_12]PJC52743.1 MAG: hypothetical protein CO030_01250 [Candidatus Magasanikbacteria bacterium CG_4_9_14_0_2_um_filter_42_11]
MWIIYGLLAHFAWAIENVGDKYLLENKIKQPIVYLYILGTLFGVSGIVGFLLFGMPVPDASVLVLIALAGIFWFYGGLPYLLAVKREEITRIAIWWNLIPIFSFLIAFVFFREILSLQQAVAFVLLLAAAFLASVHIRKGIAVFSSAIVYMLVACFLYAIYAVFLHEAMKHVTFPIAFIWTAITVGASAQVFLLSKKFRHFLHDEHLFSRKQVLGGAVLIALSEQVGSLFNQAALSLAPAALVFSLESSQVLFVFLITTVVGLFNKKVLRESFDRGNLVMKLFATVLLFVGIAVLSGK